MTIARVGAATKVIEMRRHNRSRFKSPGSNWVFSQLHLPRPLEVDQVDAMLLRMAADRAAPPLVFEARSEHSQLIQHLVGTPAEHVIWVQRTLRHLLPELDIDGINQPRLAVNRSARLRIRPRAFALATERAEVTSLSLLSSLYARLEVGERLVIQIVLGPRVTPKHLPKEIADPTQLWWQMVTIGERSAGKAVRDHVDTRSGQHGFSAVIRIGGGSERATAQTTAGHRRTRSLVERNRSWHIHGPGHRASSSAQYPATTEALESASRS